LKKSGIIGQAAAGTDISTGYSRKGCVGSRIKMQIVCA